MSEKSNEFMAGMAFALHVLVKADSTVARTSGWLKLCLDKELNQYLIQHKPTFDVPLTTIVPEDFDQMRNLSIELTQENVRLRAEAVDLLRAVQALARAVNVTNERK